MPHPSKPGDPIRSNIKENCLSFTLQLDVPLKLPVLSLDFFAISVVTAGLNESQSKSLVAWFLGKVNSSQQAAEAAHA